MTPKTKKLFIIIIPIIIIVIIAVSLTLLYLNTDFLKSNKSLFLKYVSQNIDAAKSILDNTSEKEYTNLLRQNKYEATSEISGSYTEKINTSEENKNNDINKLKIITESQSEYLNNYEYKNAKVLYNDTNIFRAEYIHEDDIYGIRFPEKFRQFLAVENHDIKQVAKNAGLTDEQIELIPDTIEEFDYNNIFSFTDEEINTLQERYLNIISSNISEDSYTKQKDAMVTIGENSYNTTAYSVTLTNEQANDIYIKILEQLKSDEIVLNKIEQLEPIALILNIVKKDETAQNTEYLKKLFVDFLEQKIQDIMQNNIGTNQVKITVYVLNGQTIRTQILEETREITLDYNITEDETTIKIQDTKASTDQENEKNIIIKKVNNGDGTETSLKTETKLGDETSSLKLYRKIKNDNQTSSTNTGMEYNDGNSNLLNLKLDENVSFSETIERKMKVDQTNTAIANNYEPELVTKWVSFIKDYLSSKIQENEAIINSIKRIELLGELLGDFQGPTVVKDENEVTEIEKNRFNARFEFYTGKEKSYEEVTQLLEEAKTSLAGAQVSYSNEGTTEDNKKLQGVKLNIESGKTNVEIANEIKERLEENKTYTVEIIKDSNDLVQNIIITTNK